MKARGIVTGRPRRANPARGIFGGSVSAASRARPERARKRCHVATWISRWAFALEFPALSQNHSLKSDAFHSLRITDEGNLSVLSTSGMFVRHYYPVRAAIFGHGDYERISPINPFVWFILIVVRGHKRSHDLLHTD